MTVGPGLSTFLPCQVSLDGRVKRVWEGKVLKHISPQIPLIAVAYNSSPLKCKYGIHSQSGLLSGFAFSHSVVLIGGWGKVGAEEKEEEEKELFFFFN